MTKSKPMRLPLKSIGRLLADLSPEEKYFARLGHTIAKNSGDHLSALEHLGINNKSNIEFPAELVIGLLLHEAGNLQHAMKYYRAAAQMTQRRSSAFAKMLIGNIFKIRGSNLAAIASLVQIDSERLEPPYRSAVFKGLSSAYRDCGNLVKANEYIEKAIKLSPDNYRYHFSRGYLYHHGPELTNGSASHFQTAFEAYQKAMDPRGESWGVLHFHLALVLGHLGDKGRMHDHLARAIELFSRTRHLRDGVNSSLALILMDRYEEGIDVLRNSLSFVDVEPTQCAIKNATALLKDANLSAGRSSLLERYINLLSDRLRDLDGRNIYKQGEWDGSETNIESSIINALVTFVDVRGFTKVMYEMPNLDHEFVSKMTGEFYNLSVEIMYPVSCYIKFVGDGMMIVSRIYGNDRGMVAQQIADCLRCISRIESAFETTSLRKEKDAKLGIGVTIGPVVRLQTREGHFDYIGTTVNLAARLCDQARPSGIVINGDPSLIKNEVLSKSLSDAVSALGGLAQGIVPEIKGIDRKKIRVFRTVDPDKANRVKRSKARV